MATPPVRLESIKRDRVENDWEIEMSLHTPRMNWGSVSVRLPAKDIVSGDERRMADVLLDAQQRLAADVLSLTAATWNFLPKETADKFIEHLVEQRSARSQPADGAPGGDAQKPSE